jgi:hypothetical protein
MEREVEMPIKDHKFKEPKYLVQPHDNDEYYFTIAKEFKASQKNPYFNSFSFREWAKKFKKNYDAHPDSYAEKIAPGDKR